MSTTSLYPFDVIQKFVFLHSLGFFVFVFFFRFTVGYFVAVMAEAMASSTSEQVEGTPRDSSREKTPGIEPRKNLSGSCLSAPAKQRISSYKMAKRSSKRSKSKRSKFSRTYSTSESNDSSSLSSDSSSESDSERSDFASTKSLYTRTRAHLRNL